MIKYEIYTDGAYSSSRNQGGWAFIVIKDNELVFKSFSGLMDTTNNRMEMMATLKALEYIKINLLEDVVVISDSMLVIETLKGNWKMKKNVDLWPLLLDLVEGVTFKHVKGHNGDKWNEECDKWAVFGSNLLNCKTDKR